MSNEFCGRCGAHWDEHDFGVPAPICPRPALNTPEAREVVQEQNEARKRIIDQLRTAYLEMERKIDNEEEILRLKSIISEVHSWIVCAAIATPEDMMQNAGHIEYITNPEYRGSGGTPNEEIYE